MDPDQSAALDLHNKARAEVSLDPLAWDATLADYAQKYANKIARKDKGMVHCQVLQSLGQGENLCHSPMGGALTYAQSSECWYAEKKDWTFGAVIEAVGPGFVATGHYTQMIWGSTAHVGMGRAISASGAVYVVARYSPPGNRIGTNPIHGQKKKKKGNTAGEVPTQVKARKKGKKRNAAVSLPAQSPIEQAPVTTKKKGKKRKPASDVWNQAWNQQTPFSVGGRWPGQMGFPGQNGFPSQIGQPFQPRRPRQNGQGPWPGMGMGMNAQTSWPGLKPVPGPSGSWTPGSPMPASNPMQFTSPGSDASPYNRTSGCCVMM